MTRTRPGIERITKAQLHSRKRQLMEDMHKHNKECVTCKRAGTDMRMRCVAWWRIARLLHSAQRDLNAYRHEVNTREPTIPGME